MKRSYIDFELMDEVIKAQEESEGYSEKEILEEMGIHIDEDELHVGKGYLGSSMSANAAEAYKEGRMPLSKWKKGMLIEKIEENKDSIKCDYELLKKQPLEVLKKLLLLSDGEYHHMGLRYGIIDFYHFDTDRLAKLTNSDIQIQHEKFLTEKKQKEIKKQQDSAENAQYDGRWEANYVKYSADGRHKREFTLTGTVKNGWFFIDPNSELEGTKKLSINGKHFNLIKQVE